MARAADSVERLGPFAVVDAVAAMTEEERMAAAQSTACITRLAKRVSDALEPELSELHEDGQLS